MYRKVERALMMNNVQRVPYYRELWQDKSGDLLFFDPAGIDWEKELITGLELKSGRWRKGYFAFPNTIYNRCFPEPEKVISRLSEIVGSANVFNSLTHFDKWEVYQALQGSEAASYLPQTYKYNEENLPQLLAEHKSLILKPRFGHGGYGVVKVTLLLPNLVTILSYAIPLPVWGEEHYIPFLIAVAPPEKFIAQQYIASANSDNYKADVRILMQKNAKGKWEVGGELSRVALYSNLLTNNYAEILPASDVASPEQLATMHSLSNIVATRLDDSFKNLGELGVDFLMDEAGRPWILEVNGKPDKSLFRKLGDDQMLRRVYLNPLDYQKHLLGN